MPPEQTEGSRNSTCSLSTLALAKVSHLNPGPKTLNPKSERMMKPPPTRHDSYGPSFCTPNLSPKSYDPRTCLMSPALFLPRNSKCVHRTAPIHDPAHEIRDVFLVGHYEVTILTLNPVKGHPTMTQQALIHEAESPIQTP